jgi:NIMA (never in mitosis gene a)-related kinase
MLEVNLLKNLNHPNIVGYKESFVEQKTLMIIMEFCEVGDMSLHIKRKLKKKEMFTEDEIFNWFI